MGSDWEERWLIRVSENYSLKYSELQYSLSEGVDEVRECEFT